MRVDARTLLTPLRLDYTVKWRFFRHLIDGNDPDAERVYRWHIEQRTGGTEVSYRTGRVTKDGVDAYVNGCRKLLSSVRKKGFRSKKAVPIDADGLPLDGAHRIAVGLALGIPVHVKEADKPAKRTWGFEWFVDHGMPSDDLERLVADWCRLRDGA